MTRTLAIINQKGGVGKTTTAVNLCAALADQGQEVLAIDLDPQAQMTAHFGLATDEIGLDHLLTGEINSNQPLTLARERIHLIQPGTRLNELEGLTSGIGRGYLLRELLARILQEQSFHYVVVDCPPSSGLLGMNALLACDELLIPVTGDYLAMVGLSRLIRIVGKLEERTGQHKEKHIVFTRFQKRRRHAREVRDRIAQRFPDLLCQSMISESVTLTESPSFGKTVGEYRTRSRSAQEHAALATELIHRRPARTRTGRVA